MQRLDLQTGKKVWSLIGCASSSLDPIFADGKIICRGVTLHAVDPLSRKRLWRIKKLKGLGTIADWVLRGDVLYVVGGNLAYAMDVSTGSVRWRIKHKTWISEVFLGRDLLFGSTRKGLIAKDVSTGSIRWQREGVGEISEVFMERGLLFVRTKNEVYALDVSTGGVRWRVESETETTNLVFFEEGHKLVFWNKAKAELVVVEAESGRILRRDGLNMKSETFFIRKLGGNFLIVEPMSTYFMAVFNQGYWPEAIRRKFGESLNVLYDVKTGEKLWEEKGLVFQN